MTKTNPYRVVEKIGKVALNVFFGLWIAFCLFLIGLIGVSQGLGWWTILLFPGILVGLILVALVGVGISWVGEKIAQKWRQSKWDWEHRNQ